MINLNVAFRAANNVSRIIQSSLRPIVLQFQPNAGVKTFEEKVGLPPKPKKPLTPFFRYILQMRPVILAQNPDLKVTDVVKEISKKWETVDPSLKKKFEEEYRKDKIVYVESRAKYDSKITEEQRLEIKQLKQDAVASKERRLTKKRIAQLERPKKPPSAFLLFISKERTQTPQRTDETYREWHAKMTEKWSRLTESDKEVYLLEFREKLVKHKEEVAVWEEKMVRLGNVDVVRHDILIDPPAKSKSKSYKKNV